MRPVTLLAIGLVAIGACGLGATQASAATLIRGARSAPPAVEAKTEAGVTVWRAPRAVDLGALLDGGAPRAEAPRIIVEIRARPPRQVSTQGFYSGDPQFSRRYTQGFYSGPPVRRGSSLIVIDRR